MNEKTRFIIAKYLLAIAALLPIKNKANAKPGYNLPSNIYMQHVGHKHFICLLAGAS